MESRTEECLLFDTHLLVVGQVTFLHSNYSLDHLITRLTRSVSNTHTSTISYCVGAQTIFLIPSVPCRFDGTRFEVPATSASAHLSLQTCTYPIRIYKCSAIYHLLLTYHYPLEKSKLSRL